MLHEENPMDEMINYRDFNSKHHTIDPAEIAGYGHDPRGSCYMITKGGLKLDNMASESSVRDQVKEIMDALRAHIAVLPIAPACCDDDGVSWRMEVFAHDKRILLAEGKGNLKHQIEELKQGQMHCQA